jgi:hypothetical protein
VAAAGAVGAEKSTAMASSRPPETEANLFMGFVPWSVLEGGTIPPGL